MATTTTAKKRNNTTRRSNADKAPAGRASAAHAAMGEPALLPEVEGSEQEYRRFLPAAEAVAAAEVKAFRADASLAHHNALEGVKNVFEHEATLRKDLPHEDLDALRSVPSLCLAVSFAALKVDGTPEAASTTREDLRAARGLRRKLLKGFDALTEAGFFTAKEHAAIVAGRGPIDVADDCVQLASKLRAKWPEIRTKTAITAAEIARAAELGTSLYARFKSARAKTSRARTGDAAAAADVRDRLWTLALTRSDRLWSVGALLFGRAVDDYVPSLQSSRVQVSAARRAASARKVADAAATKAARAAEKASKAAAKKPAR
jgi:hypothetical protein